MLPKRVNCWSVIDSLPTGRKFVLDKKIADLCKRFAEESYETNKDEWKKRGQDKEYIIIPQICLGKKGEWGVRLFFIHRGYVCSKPNMKIQPISEKSFKRDLNVIKSAIDYDIHVKSVDIDSTSGASWVFQKRDITKLVQEGRRNVYIVFTIVNGNDVYIVSVVPIRDIKERYLKPLYSRQVGKTKRAIYYEDIIRIAKDRVS